MGLTLILTRHGKSSWADPETEDFDRPLNDRGRTAATRLGRWLAKRDLVPDEVLVSGARRTVETWAGMAPEMDSTPGMRTERGLYLAAPDAMLEVLRGATGARVLMIGHNPGIARFAQALAAAPARHDRFADYPTGATTVIGFDDTGDGWAGIGWGDGRVRDFVVPRELG